VCVCTYHPEERLIGEAHVPIDRRQNAEYETDKHHHKPAANQRRHSLNTSNKALIDGRLRPRCCHLGSYFKRPKSSPVRPLACNWYYCAHSQARERNNERHSSGGRWEAKRFAPRRWSFWSLTVIKCRLPRQNDSAADTAFYSRYAD